MSFAGHVFDMIARMKANARRKRRPFDREVGTARSAIDPRLLRPARPEELDAIREKLAEQRRSQRKVELILFLVLFVLIALAGWLFL